MTIEMIFVVEQKCSRRKLEIFMFLFAFWAIVSDWNYRAIVCFVRAYLLLRLRKIRNANCVLVEMDWGRGGTDMTHQLFVRLKIQSGRGSLIDRTASD